MLKELLQIPNLLSLFRIFLTFIIWYFMASNGENNSMICLALVILAGITDGLDGYFARKLNQITETGKIMDPLADKLFAGILIVLLIIYRDFPLWLAGVIIGRDLLILLASVILLRGRKTVLSSTLTGKYTFAAIAFLLASYTVRFTFGIYLCSVIVVILVTLSTLIYTRDFIYFKKYNKIPLFNDKPIFKIIRGVLQICFYVMILYEFIINFLTV